MNTSTQKMLLPKRSLLLVNEDDFCNSNHVYGVEIRCDKSKLHEIVDNFFHTKSVF